MNEIDYHYYRTFDQIGLPFYDWERHIINLGCNKEDIKIDNVSSEPNKEGLKNTSKLVHEYIHYLQNFCTVWGAPVFTDIALAIMKIGASSVESKEKLSLPLVKSNIENTLLIEGIKLREDVIRRINKCDNFLFQDCEELSNITQVQTDSSCIVLSNSRVTTNLGLKVIREHMAHIGTQLFLGKSDDEIHEYNETLDSFKFFEIPFSKQSEYWILFENFYQTQKFKNLAKGIFHLTQQSLATLNPEKALYKFFTWYNKKAFSIGTRTDFVELVENWLKDENKIYYLHLDLTKSIDHCKKIVELTEKHKNEHDLFQFVNKIANFSLKNIQSTTDGQLIFTPSDNFQDIKFWKQLMVKYGTGLVRYLDGTVIHGNQKHCKEMMDCFNFFISCSLVIKKLLENQIANCPFLDDIPICKAEFKGENNCVRNPFLVNQKSDGKSCLFRNGVLLTGMQDRIEFSS
ncbi:MAG: hypothetical protein QQN41_06060 [Nitrosopumilus sp.]